MREDTESATAYLEDAAEKLDAADMALDAAAARRRLGTLLGDERGDALVAEADAWMQQEGISNPERMAAMLAP